MALLNQTAQSYYDGNDYGNYQFVSLTDIINQFMLIYVGEDKIIPKEKRLELPVAEYLQSGLANGMAIEGMIPVSTYPRWNFLLMGTDQIINHLDKFKSMSNGKLQPKVIIRVAVGSEHPVDPQCQHKGNFSEAFRNMTNNTEVIELIEPEDIIPAYNKALNRNDGVNTILVEFADYCKTK